MLTFQDIFLVSALLAPFQTIFPPPLADLTWCWFSVISSVCPNELSPPIPSNILWLLELGRKIGMAVYNMTFSFLAYLLLISIEIGCLGHFMPDTIVQVANACEI